MATVVSWKTFGIPIGVNGPETISAPPKRDKASSVFTHRGVRAGGFGGFTKTSAAPPRAAERDQKKGKNVKEHGDPGAGMRTTSSRGRKS
jgi:hypothetical protein